MAERQIHPEDQPAPEIDFHKVCQLNVCAVDVQLTSSSEPCLEKRRNMRSGDIPSPDEADAVALGFSESDGNAFVRELNFHRSLVGRYGGGYLSSPHMHAL